MPSPWVWNDSTKRYRDTKTGRFIGAKKALELRDVFTDAQKKVTDRLAKQLSSGDISIQRWVLDMRETIKVTYIDQYALAIGGRNKMTQADWGRIGGILRPQYQRLNGFATQITNGELSLRQIQSRSGMYIESASQAFERAKASDLGVPRLPQYPGDGRTQCLSNCRCDWTFVEGEDVWECTWNLNPAEHCPDCLANAARWNPLVLPK